MKVFLSHLLLPLLVLYGNQMSSAAWAPPSVQRRYSSLARTMMMTTNAEIALQTSPSSAALLRTLEEKGARNRTTATDYTDGFTSDLEARRKELEQANAESDKITVALLDPNQSPLSKGYTPKEDPFKDTVLVMASQSPSKKKKKDDLDQALAFAANGVKTVFQAIGFVAKESVEAAKSLNATTTFVGNADVTYGQAMSKIRRSGQGILKLGMELVRGSLPRWDSFYPGTLVMRGTHKIEETPSLSATLPVVAAKLDSTSRVAPVVTYRPTIALSPAQASVVWGYKIEEEETEEAASSSIGQDFSLDQLKEMAHHAGQWTEHVLSSAAKDVTKAVDGSIQAVVDDMREDLAHQKAAYTTNNNAAERVIAGPAYFLNVHVQSVSPTVSSSFAAKITPRRPTIVEDKVFFFAN